MTEKDQSKIAVGARVQLHHGKGTLEGTVSALRVHDNHTQAVVLVPSPKDGEPPTEYVRNVHFLSVVS